MKNPTKKLALALLTICTAAFAQPEPTKNTEAELATKQQAMVRECAIIAKATPCAVGVGDVDKLPAALQRSERDARYKLAQVVKVFVSYAATDSSFIENTVSQEFSRLRGHINIDSLALVYSVPIAQEYGVVTDEISGKKFYRTLTLMVLNPKLYAEAQEAIVPLPPSPSSTSTQSSSSTKPQSSSSIALQISSASTSYSYFIPPIDLKRIATKTLRLLIGLIL